MINHFVALTDHRVSRCSLYSKKQGVWVEPVQEKEQKGKASTERHYSFRVYCNQRNRGMKKQKLTKQTNKKPPKCTHIELMFK